MKKERTLLTGEIGSSMNPPAGCLFHPRCPYATDACRKVEPIMVEDRPGSGHLVACPVVLEQKRGN